MRRPRKCNWRGDRAKGDISGARAGSGAGPGIATNVIMASVGVIMT